MRASVWGVRSTIKPTAQPPLSITTDKRYKRDNHTPRVDDDFQQRYKAAERAYGAGDYLEAGRIGLPAHY